MATISPTQVIMLVLNELKTKYYYEKVQKLVVKENNLLCKF